MKGKLEAYTIAVLGSSAHHLPLALVACGRGELVNLTQGQCDIWVISFTFLVSLGIRFLTIPNEG